MAEALTIPLPKEPRHQRFADRLLAGDSTVDAYLAAGYRCSRDSAMHAGTRLRNHPEVIAYLKAIQTKVAGSTVLSVLEKRQFFARIVRVPLTAINPDDEDDPNRDLIKKVERRYRTDDDEIEYCTEKLEKHDPLKAIELDNKLSGDDPEANLLNQMAESLAALGGNGAIPTDTM